MITLLVIIIILASLLLGFIILIQNSKGGGLASNFAGQNQVLGVKRTTDFLEKATWTIAAVIMVLCMTIAIIVRNEAKSMRPTIPDTEQTEEMPQ